MGHMFYKEALCVEKMLFGDMRKQPKQEQTESREMGFSPSSATDRL